ncbi:MAG: hypothetical protein GY738_30545 [Pseudoalteromonas sp.]|nr:hypothetical protein [Pseudoalteromonas sp.]
MKIDRFFDFFSVFGPFCSLSEKRIYNIFKKWSISGGFQHYSFGIPRERTKGHLAKQFLHENIDFSPRKSIWRKQDCFCNHFGLNFGVFPLPGPLKIAKMIFSKKWSHFWQET